jgi:hypothetical protein
MSTKPKEPGPAPHKTGTVIMPAPSPQAIVAPNPASRVSPVDSTMAVPLTPDPPKLDPPKEAPGSPETQLSNLPMMPCPTCGVPTPVAMFCTDCGALMQKRRFCAECGIPQKGTAKFCEGCGAKQ